VSIPLQWEGEPVPHHLEVLQTANDSDDFLSQALRRVYPPHDSPAVPTAAILSPLATGGAMAVYKIMVLRPHQSPQYLVGKIPRERRIVYASGTGHQEPEETTHVLLERLVILAEHLAQHTPGLFPRSGGVWHGQLANGAMQHLLVEEFIPGVSVERLKHTYEEQLMAGQLSTAAYQQYRSAAERLAVAAYIRLWNCLERCLFTSDPSPWNVLIRPSGEHGDEAPTATIIDLHGLEDHASLTYVIQRLAAVYGMRQEIVEEAILPGMFDVLGLEEGRALLRAELPQLEAHAEQTRKNLGVDLQGPVLRAIRNLGFQEQDGPFGT
jgi:hypothetical protein